MKKKKKKMKMKKKENMNTTLPQDLIANILLRLPVRTLLRFKLVCKSWLSLILDPQFAKSHFDLAAEPTHRLLLERNDDEIESLDVAGSLYDDSAFVRLKLPPYSAPCFITLGSCRGFVLLTKMMSPTSDLIVWNPSTGSHREIPATCDNWDSWYDPSTRVHRGIPSYFSSLLFNFLYGFGYDQSKDDYLLVIIPFGRCEPQVIDNSRDPSVVCVQYGGAEVNSSRPRIEVLSLITNVPSFYGVDIEYLDVGFESKSGLFLDKSLHWLVTSKATQLHVVIAFDLVERTLSEIPLSHELAAELAIYKEYYLRVLGGCLGLCYMGEGDDGHEVSVIWVMKDYKLQSCWTKSFVLSNHDDDMSFLPICFIKDGGVFGLDENGEFQKFDDKGELLENHTYGLSDKGALKYFDMYVETLLTLPSELR